MLLITSNKSPLYNIIQYKSVNYEHPKIIINSDIVKGMNTIFDLTNSVKLEILELIRTNRFNRIDSGTVFLLIAGTNQEYNQKINKIIFPELSNEIFGKFQHSIKTWETNSDYKNYSHTSFMNS